MPSSRNVFELGMHVVRWISLESETPKCSSTFVPVPAPAPAPAFLLPPKPLLIVAPCEEGEFPVLVFLHGFLLSNAFYSQLMHHVASHGFIVIAPQLYNVAGPDSEDEIKSAAMLTDWLIDGLPPVLPPHIRPNLRRLGLAGHSRGGKVAFALALGLIARPTLPFSALIGIDPVDGMDRGNQTNPPILTYIPNSLDVGTPVLVIGSGLGGAKRNPMFPPCAPEGVSHQDFYDECCSPACHFVVREYGHLDMLDDETKGLRGKASYCLCKNGKNGRKPMREFVGGVMVAFLKGYLGGEMEDLLGLRDKPETAPVELSVVSFRE